MEILSDVVNYLLSLGAAIFVPIIIIIAGLIVRMKLKDAISAGITLGVAFTGMTMLINFMTGAISPAAEAMLKNTDLHFFPTRRSSDLWLDHNVNHFLVLAICVPNVSTHDCHQYNHAGY